MDNKRMYIKVVLDLLIGIAIIIFACFVLPKAIIFFMPFVIGWLVSIVANPIVRFMERKIKIVRKYGTVILIFVIIIVILAAMYFLLMILYHQFMEFAQNAPGRYDNIVEGMEKLRKKYGLDELTIENSMNIISNENLLNIVKSAASGCVFTLFTILASYFFVVDRNRIEGRIQEFFPDSFLRKYKMITSNFRMAVGGYFIAQFKLMFIIIIILFISFLILRIKYSFLIAVGIGILDFLPILGTGIVLGPWAVYAIFEKKYYLAAGLILVYVICQVVKQVLEPKMVGESLGLSSFTTLFLLYAGFQIGGILGIIIAIPVGVIIVNLWRAGAFNDYLEDIAFLLDKMDEFRKEDEE